MKARCCALLTLLLFVAATVQGQAAKSDGAAANNVLHDGTPIYLATGRTVSSQSDQPGEEVEFLVKKDVVAGDQIVIESGSTVHGKVIASRLDDRNAGRGGMVEFRLESVKLASGQMIPLRNIKDVPTAANADVSPEALTNLVNSPYAPFAHFNDGNVTTVPKSSLLTLYVAADVAIGSQVVVTSSYVQNAPSDSVASHIVNSPGAAKSLGDIAREQRAHGKISDGMVARQN